MTMSTDAQEAFQGLADSLSPEDRRDFFPQLAERLAELLDADHVLVARTLPDGRRVRSLGAWSRGGRLEAFDYDLAGTPCERVIDLEPCRFPEGVRERFPEDRLLADMGAEAYLGVPMFAPDDRLLGLVVALYERPVHETGLALEALRIAASRAGAELAGQQAERALSRTHRALTLLRLVNRAVIRATNEPRLLKEICRLATGQQGGYRMAWVGYALHDEARRVMPQAFAGLEEGYLNEVWFSWDADSPQGQAPAGRCIRTGRPVVLEDLVPDPAYARWREAARRRGYRGVIALPLRDGDRTFGALMLLQGTVGGVADEELALLEELAENLAFGLRTLKVQTERERTQKAVLDIAEALTARSDAAFFAQLVRHMVDALGADAGFISRLEGGEPPMATTLAGIVDGEPAAPQRYSLAGKPCHVAFERRELIVDDGLPERFPGVELVETLGARAYAGRRLDDAAGRPIGSLFLLYRRPMLDTAMVSHLLRIFAAGAAAELERHRSEAHMRHLAYYDSGTGLPNRACFMERLQEAVARAGHGGYRLALLFLDLNRFKEINDSQGHDVGDRVLRQVAGRFQGGLGEGASLARLGGDEFVVMLEDTDACTAEAMVARLARSLEEPIVVGERRFSLEVSIGVAFYPDHADGPRELLKHTDIAMYRAKQAGVVHRVYDAAMGEAMARRLSLAGRLASALAEGALALHYQPCVDMASGTLIGAEVLCRWQDPELGWISPAEFIPIAEERGMLPRLGEWVLREACAQRVAWRGAGLEMPGRLHINVGAQQLEDPRLSQRLAGIVEAAGLSPSVIGLELTESGFMADPEQAVAVTRSLREAGFALAIDDFGTGYSSLAYLKRLAVDTVKIDMSFVRDMLSDDNDRAIVTTIIAIAESLGLATLAEGVESRAQAEALLAQGCRHGQGFLFDRALPAEAFAERWLVAG
ncbi:EAL domain-containing protein [Halomonas beimenensis]|uniref:Diguanylate cyclase/phosphodiesterase (GGDEF & EAL domains) with PAS/PAC sensor(S) n=1 Tax=Halomonas beimenensis TaxID=475662 RepID=A0A291PCK8_9GAMM|nr:EAL domain-containing protein [Halomonas beimenensis]ATJ84612.1 diguanylate cyclase/phosphodiesterase (GGDEF & EAL domains) with PAS/PAC sensor(s) [Halomonas beimenensis]